MKNLWGYITSVFILIAVLNCSKIEEKVQQKVNEKVDQKIEENMKKIDSTFSKEKLDSLKKIMDSLSTDQDKRSKKVK
jgi:hypothetical protein